MRTRSLVVLTVVVVGLGLGLTALLWPSGSDPISEDQALATFRENTTEGDGSTPSIGPAGPGAAGSTPADGVYRYRTSGTESVKLGPLPAESREYPALTTATAAAGEDGCFEFGLNLIEQHTEDTTWCRTGEGGVRLVTQVKRQSVAQFDPTVTIGCDPGVLWRPGTDRLPLDCTLVLGGGPMEVTADYSGEASSSAATVPVEGEPVEVVALDMHFDLTGSVSGTWDERLWLATDSALPVRLEREFHLDGFATFDEEFRLDLESMSPAL